MLIKYIPLIIFSAISITKSAAQDTVLKPTDVRIYFQSVTYSIPEQNIASSLVIYDTYYHKIDSIAVPKEGLYLNLPKIDLIFKVRPMAVGYKPKGGVFYADELKDSIKIIIDPKGVSRCPLIIRSILFAENSYALDSTALYELKEIKRTLLLMDDSTHCFNVEVHSTIDVLEKKKGSELLKNRARVVKEVLMKNNAMNFTLFVTNKKFRPIDKPKNDEEHAYNRCVNFKIGLCLPRWSELEIKMSE